MKIFRTIPCLLVAVGAFLPATLYSQTYLYWDINGSGPCATDGTTADGIWDIGLTPNWNVSSNGSSSGTRTWVNPFRAVFAAGTNATGSSFIEIVGAPQIPEFIVEEGNWTFTGGTLRVFSQATLDVATGSSVTIHSSFEVMPFNAFDMWKTGGGNLTLTHNLTGQVDIRIDGGNLTFEATEDASPVIT